MPSDAQPGEVVTLPDGRVLDGSNPAFADVKLPGPEPIETFECAIIGTAEANALVSSLDGAGWSEGASWTLYSEDLTELYLVSIGQVIPGWEAYGCGPPPEEVPPPAPPPGDLSALDGCAIVAPDVATALLGADEVSPAAPPLNFDVASPGCKYSSQDPEAGFGFEVATLYLYGRTVDEPTARQLVPGHLGPVDEEAIDGHPVWVSRCWELERSCPGVIGGWADGRLVYIAAGQTIPGRNPPISVDDARSLMRAVLEAVGTAAR
jgi:hypothetical protein